MILLKMPFCDRLPVPELEAEPEPGALMLQGLVGKSGPAAAASCLQ